MNRTGWKEISVATFFGLAILSPISINAASAEEIGVANFGTASNGMPWAVALEKGFFKDEGVDITGIVSSLGGGPDLRVLLGGQLPYAEAGLSAVANANQGGADLLVVSTNADTVADGAWVTTKDSPVNSVADLKGRRLGFTNPGSTTQALAYWMVDNAGIDQKDVEFIATGSLGAALTALENDGIDVSPMWQPVFTMDNSRYKVVARGSDLFPPISNTIGVVSREVAEARPDVVRGIIAARRKAVEFMHENPHESAQLIAKHYNLPPEVIETVIVDLMQNGTVDGVPYWGPGNIQYVSLKNLVHAMTLIGAFQGEIDWDTLVDESYLPEDLRSKK
jgi:NitT/TauT family transport system substrate-binding protein